MKKKKIKKKLNLQPGPRGCGKVGEHRPAGLCRSIDRDAPGETRLGATAWAPGSFLPTSPPPHPAVQLPLCPSKGGGDKGVPLLKVHCAVHLFHRVVCVCVIASKNQ